MMKLHIAAAVVVAGLSTGSAWASPYVLSAGPGGLTAGDLTGWVAYTGTPSLNEHVFVGPLNMNVTDTAIPSTYSRHCGAPISSTRLCPVAPTT
jgi:hypothetical protein